ncbi:MAG TPA: DNA internalization-related competence protein ComEC/Rec2 [Thioalkalivibrio sp.]|nr:DNA internalization-related competence protein ComEC/Rec2 [Thioalkalivibrio sp.]
MRLVSLGLLAGMVAAHQVAELPPMVLGLALLPALLLLASSGWILRLAGAVAIGLLWAWFHAHLVLHPALDSALEGQDLVLDGTVRGLTEHRHDAIRFLFEPDARHAGVPARLRLSWYRTEASPVAGERWRLTVRLKRPSGFQNPGGFDYEGWLFQQRIGATGYVRARGVNERLAVDGCPLDCLRAELRARLTAAGGERRHFGIMLALALGDRSHIDPPAWDVLLRTGTNHLVAISGLHIGLVGGLVFWLLRALAARVPVLALYCAAPRWGAAGGLLAALAYAALAGFSIPTQRALIMLAVLFGAILLGRELRASTGLAAALLAVLLLDPTATLAPGFWLSFAAVAVLLYGFRGRLRPSDPERHPLARLVDRVGGWVRAQYLLALGLLPLTAFWFQRAALGAPLANLVAVPWVSLLVVPPVLLAALVAPVWPPFSGWLLGVVSAVFDPLWGLLAALAAADGQLWHRPAPGPLVLGLAAVGLAWLLLPRGMPGRLLGACLCLPLLLPAIDAPESGAAEVTLLDVGQGLAAVVRTRHHTLVFDTGPRFSRSFDAGDAVMVPYLRHRGVGGIDVLVVSHGDNDHRGGARSVLAQMPTQEVLASVPEEIAWPGARHCVAGEHWRWDGVDFEILHPSPDYRGSANNGSCVLRVSTGEQVVLFAGDIEAEAEWALVRAHGERLRSQVLVVPHHGSNTSSTAYFLDAVNPQVALVPAGYRNRFGFPKPEVLARYAAREVEVFDTAQSGALHFVLSAEGVSPVTAYREESRRFWHRGAGL